MTGPTPERQVSSALRCDRPTQGDGLMSYPCSLTREHQGVTSDPADPQPCYAVESGRSVRAWQAWSKREEGRKAILARPQHVIDCPSCRERAMLVTDDGGTCQECGQTARFQSSPSEISVEPPTKQREGDQVLPTGDESIEDDQSLVIADIEIRRKVGIQRYGQGHRPFNGRNTLLDAYEEALDGAVYLRSLLRTRAALHEDLLDVVGRVLYDPKRHDGGVSVEKQIADRVIDFVTLRIEEARAQIEEGEKAKIPARRQVTSEVRRSLGTGPHKMDQDGSWVSQSYLLDVLDKIERQGGGTEVDSEHPDFVQIREAEGGLSMAMTYGDWLRDDLDPDARREADLLAARVLGGWKIRAKAEGFLRPGVDEPLEDQ